LEHSRKREPAPKLMQCFGSSQRQALRWVVCNQLEPAIQSAIISACPATTNATFQGRSRYIQLRHPLVATSRDMQIVIALADKRAAPGAP
jgi:hypothetical protein